MVSSQQQDSIRGLCDNSSTAGLQLKQTTGRKGKAIQWMNTTKIYLGTGRLILIDGYTHSDSGYAARTRGVRAVCLWKLASLNKQQLRMRDNLPDCHSCWTVHQFYT